MGTIESKGRIGILTGGGDCSGLNAVIASAVKRGVSLGYDFVGFFKGFEGFLDPPMYKPLGLEDVRGISHLGGTILHTTNKGRFAGKKGAGEGSAIPEEIMAMAKRNLEMLAVDGLIVIGGDGSLSAAMQLHRAGVPVVGVPKTIDNDLMATDQTFGFSTAVQVVVDAMDRVHTTASSHDRVVFVEVMGRNAGWIALRAGLAGGADVILIPEINWTVESLVKYLRARKARRGSSLVCVAEGAKLDGNVSLDGGKASEQHYGGISSQIMAAVEQAAPGEFEMRDCVLGHIQRGGTPNARDRTLAKSFGLAAIDAFANGQTGTMVALRNGELITVQLQDAVARLKTVTPDCMEVQSARKLGIFLGEA